MTDCKFTQFREQLICIYCAQIYQGKPTSDPKNWPHRNCTNSPDLRPAAAKLGVNLQDTPGMATLLAEWLAAGEPERTAAEIADCKAVCDTCEHHTAMEDRCQSGHCSQKGRRLAVPRRMATYHCPEAKWPGDGRQAVKEEVAKASQLGT